MDRVHETLNLICAQVPCMLWNVLSVRKRVTGNESESDCPSSYVADRAKILIEFYPSKLILISVYQYRISLSVSVLVYQYQYRGRHESTRCNRNVKKTHELNRTRKDKRVN